MQSSSSVVVVSCLELFLNVRMIWENGIALKTDLGWKLLGFKYRLESVGLEYPLYCIVLLSSKYAHNSRICTLLPNCTSVTGNSIPYFLVSLFSCVTKLSNAHFVPLQIPMQLSILTLSDLDSTKVENLRQYFG